MKVVSNPSNQNIKSAARALIEGQLVVFPTETVYGLGGNAENSHAVERIYSAKGRPTSHPVIVHISSVELLSDWALNIPEYAYFLAEKFWPGPMTLILERSKKAQNFITGGQDKVGLRVPNQSIALELLKEFENIGGSGIAAPSANLFGKVSPTTAEAVLDAIGSELDYKDLILDGGQCKIGIESTIINCTEVNPSILRPGAITNEMLSIYLKSNSDMNTEIKYSGNLKSHYAPKARVFIDQIPNKGDGFLALKEVPTPAGAVRLATPKDANQYATQLYEAFRLADKLGLTNICVFTPPAAGIGIAIIDRLKRSQVEGNIG